MASNWQISEEEFWTTETEDSTVEEITELADGFEGYEAMDFHWYAQRVADRIFHIHQARGVVGQFVFSLTCNADGEIDGAVVNLDIPHSEVYLVRSIEWKRMTDDRSATGRAGILAIKSALLDYEYALLRRFAETHGLV